MDIEQLEALTLAAERGPGLAQLIPGTEDHYYHHCLAHQLAGELDEVDALLDSWRERLDPSARSPRLREIATRQLLLSYARAPDEVLDTLRQLLGLSFDHQRAETQAAARRELPSVLDPARISVAAFEGLIEQKPARELLDHVSDRGLWRLCETGRYPAHLRKPLLERLRHPHYPKLVELVLAVLDDPQTRGFEALANADLLTAAQLDALAAARPALRDDRSFVLAVLARMQPGPELDLEREREARAAYLDQLWAFVEPLSPAFNDLAVHVLYHRLDHDRRAGVYARERLIRYLQLPRQASYLAPAYRERHRDALARFGTSFHAATGLATVRDDQALVVDYLEHLFADPALTSPEAFAPYLDDSFLRRVLAEAKLLSGADERERWYAMLDDPSDFDALERRVELRLGLDNPRDFGPDDPVELAVELKRVPTLVVRVFELNVAAYFAVHRDAVPSDVDLDGLIARDERVIDYDQPALRRHRERLALPELGAAGTYVVELIGGGMSSRALIRKGQLDYVERMTSAGHALTIIDAEGEPVAGARVDLAGRVYEADEGGEVRIPFASSTGAAASKILLVADRLATVRRLRQRGERYELTASFHVAREQLIAERQASVVVRAALRAHGNLVSPGLLVEPKLTITATDRFGTASTLTAPIALEVDAEASHEFRVPPALASLEFELRAKVERISDQREVELRCRERVEVNEIDRSATITALHLAAVDTGYQLWALGKTGEARPGLQVNLSVGHELFVPRLELALRTDARGCVELGALAGIVDLQASLGDQVSRWILPRSRSELPPTLQLHAGEALTLPCPDPREGLAPPALFELRGRTHVRDRSGALAQRAGVIALDGLEPGDYALVLPEGEALTLRVGGPKLIAGWAVSPIRRLARLPLALPTITAAKTDDEAVSVELAGWDASTRVHVFASRFVPTAGAQSALALASWPPLAATPAELEPAVYLSGRDIGDEYRYILERRRAQRFPGNMLERPSLLLNPWDLDTTSATTRDAREAERYAAASAPAPRRAPPPAPRQSRAGLALAPSTNYDFLPAPAVVILNLEPDAEGRVRVPRSQLGDAQHLELVVANAIATSSRPLALAPVALAPRDLRLRHGLDPARHFIKRKQIECLRAEHSLRFRERHSTDHSAVGTLAKAHALLSTLSDDDATLATFEFVTRWPSLAPARQRELYSEYACHELHLFLSRKDPQFFAELIRPYLANKREQTFLDHYLLGHDLRAYLEPWAYGRLNVLERILLAGRLRDQGEHADEPEVCARHVAERAERSKPDAELINALFDVALRGSALEAGEDMFREEEETLAVGGAAIGGLALDDDDAEGGGPPPPSSPKRAKRAKRKRERGGLDLERDDRARAQTKPAYRGVDKTKKWAENHYYRVPLAEQHAGRIVANRFWRDYAAHVAAGDEAPFLSGNFVFATANFSEAMAALAVLDLPFEGEEPRYEVDGAGAIMRTSTAHVVFHAQLSEVEAEPESLRPDLLVAQDYFRRDDRYRWIDGERHEHPVSGEFLIHTVYLCRVALTNVSAAPRELSLLIQIPRGAMPVHDGAETRDRHLTLAPHQTQVHEYAFYFPAPGRFAHYPVHVAHAGELVAHAPPTTLEVVRELSDIDTRSWAYVSQSGSLAELLDHLRTHNIERLELDQLAWRMREREAYDAILDLVEARHVYAPTLWAYSLHHRDAPRIATFLRHQDAILRRCGYALDSPLVSTQPHPRAWYEHLEFAPLVHARAHPLGDKLHIDNHSLAAHYREFLATLAYRPAPTSEQLCAATYYLLVQDRVAEAIETLARVDPEQLSGALQYDYLRAYVALHRDDTEQARTLAARHRDHPVDRWRKRFVAILNLLDELDGDGPKLSDRDSREQVQDAAAATEPSLELELEGRELIISAEGLRSCTLSYYRMDIELLFSRQPFMRDQSARFALVQPNARETVELPAGRAVLRHPLPDAYRRANALIEVASAGLHRSVASYAHALELRVVEAYGQLRVYAREGARQPLPRTYVKVYARRSGGVAFYKDGYTDLRGAFDYATLSVGGPEDVERFAILIMSEDHGALIRELGPPR